MREVFADGEKQFDAIKKDAYDGISDTYYDVRHQTGYSTWDCVKSLEIV